PGSRPCVVLRRRTPRRGGRPRLPRDALGLKRPLSHRAPGVSSAGRRPPALARARMSAPSASSRHGALTRDEIADLATLAGLAVAPDEARRLADDLGAILDHMSELAAVDTDGVPPMTHAVAVPLRLRPDLVAPS